MDNTPYITAVRISNTGKKGVASARATKDRKVKEEPIVMYDRLDTTPEPVKKQAPKKTPVKSVRRNKVSQSMIGIQAKTPVPGPRSEVKINTPQKRSLNNSMRQDSEC